MLKTVTFFSTLMRYAREQAEAEKGGDQAKIAEAKKRHEDYRQAVLASDECVIPTVRRGGR
jgi:hypothetical protein